MSWPSSLWENRPQYPLSRNPGWALHQSGCFREVKISCSWWELSFVSLVRQSLAQSQYRLWYTGSFVKIKHTGKVNYALGIMLQNELPVTIEDGNPLTLLGINSSPTVCSYCVFITVLNDTRKLFCLSVSNLRMTQVLT